MMIMMRYRNHYHSPMMLEMRRDSPAGSLECCGLGVSHSQQLMRDLVGGGGGGQTRPLSAAADASDEGFQLNLANLACCAAETQRLRADNQSGRDGAGNTRQSREVISSQDSPA